MFGLRRHRQLKSPHIVGLFCPYSRSLLTRVWSTQATNARLELLRGTGTRRGIGPRASAAVWQRGDEDEAGLRRPGGWWTDYASARNSFLRGREGAHQKLFQREWEERETRKREIWRMRREVSGNPVLRAGPGAGGDRGGERGEGAAGEGGEEEEEDFNIYFKLHEGDVVARRRTF